MLGQATAAAEPVTRQWLVRWWGHPYIDMRQKWRSVAPHLTRLPRDGVRLLDAGCGSGPWTLELGARRPGWEVIGLDRDGEALRAAEVARVRLGLGNVSFVRADFLSADLGTFDVVLSVASAHYLVESGRGTALFRKFAAWLKPDGVLLLYGSRARHEVPQVSFLPRLPAREVFSRDGLRCLCRECGLEITQLSACVGRLGTLAQQIACLRGAWRPVALAAYPMQLLLTMLDRWDGADRERRSAAWVLVARHASGRGGAPPSASERRP